MMFRGGSAVFAMGRMYASLVRDNKRDDFSSEHPSTATLASLASFFTPTSSSYSPREAHKGERKGGK